MGRWQRSWARLSEKVNLKKQNVLDTALQCWWSVTWLPSTPFLRGNVESISASPASLCAVLQAAFFPPQCHTKPKSQGKLFLCYVFVCMRHSQTGSCPVLIRFSVRSCLTYGSSRNHNIVISIWVLPIYLHFLGWESDRTHITEHTMLICSTIKEPCKWIYVHMCIWTHQPYITGSYSSNAFPVLTTLFSLRV